MAPWGNPEDLESKKLLVMREVDSVGRVGGEEFLVLARETSEDGASSLAERIRSTVASTPIEYNGRAIQITVSLGVAVAENGALSHAQALLHAADRALYRAKARGRNRVELASETATPLTAPSALG